MFFFFNFCPFLGEKVASGANRVRGRDFHSRTTYLKIFIP
jgi:hypothetical protein